MQFWWKIHFSVLVEKCVSFGEQWICSFGGKFFFFVVFCEKMCFCGTGGKYVFVVWQKNIFLWFWQENAFWCFWRKMWLNLKTNIIRIRVNLSYIFGHVHLHSDAPIKFISMNHLDESYFRLNFQNSPKWIFQMIFNFMSKGLSVSPSVIFIRIIHLHD